MNQNTENLFRGIRLLDITQNDNKTRHRYFITFVCGLVSSGQGFNLTIFYSVFFCCLWSFVPSQGNEGPVKVRKHPQDTIQEMAPHQALSDQAPSHLQGKHITDYLACVETIKTHIIITDLHNESVSKYKLLLPSQHISSISSHLYANAQYSTGLYSHIYSQKPHELQIKKTIKGRQVRYYGCMLWISGYTRVPFKCLHESAKIIL